MKNLAIIPARSGSKGLKDKNIKLLAGKPLLAYSVEAAFKSGLFSTVMVSTDSSQYAAIARSVGADVPWLRDASLSTDVAGSWSVVRSELLRYAEAGSFFDTVCLLQPTSPLRTAEDIKASYRLLEERSAQAVTSVCEAASPPQFMTPLDETLSLSALRSGLIELESLRRQDMPLYYRLNGAIYIRRVSYSEGRVALNEVPEIAYIMDVNASVDIDGLLDFYTAEGLLAGLGVSAR